MPWGTYRRPTRDARKTQEAENRLNVGGCWCLDLIHRMKPEQENEEIIYKNVEDASTATTAIPCLAPLFQESSDMPKTSDALFPSIPRRFSPRLPPPLTPPSSFTPSSPLFLSPFPLKDIFQNLDSLRDHLMVNLKQLPYFSKENTHSASSQADRSSVINSPRLQTTIIRKTECDPQLQAGRRLQKRALRLPDTGKVKRQRTINFQTIIDKATWSTTTYACEVQVTTTEDRPSNKRHGAVPSAAGEEYPYSRTYHLIE